MIEDLKGNKILKGFRGMPSINMDMLATALVDISKFGTEMAPYYESVDFNPVIFYENDYVVVDAKILLRDKPDLQRSGLLFRCGFLRQQGFAAQTNLAGRIDVDHLDEDLLAFFEFVPNVLDAMVRDLRDVEQAVGAGHDLDERAKVGDSLDLSQVRLVQLRRRRQFLNDRNRLRG